MVTPTAVPRGGVVDLVVSWLLAAALIPIFFFGKATFGRVSGLVFVLVYFGYAAARIIYS